MAGKREAARCRHQLKRLFAEWSRVLEKGGNDHEVADGYVLNRIRGEILQAMEEIETVLPEDAYPEDYYAPVPELMPEDYMARPEGIRENAERLYRRLDRCSEWKWLKEQEGVIPEEDRQKTDFYRVKGMVEKLENALAEDDCPVMRQFEEPDDLMIMVLNCHSQVTYLQGRREKKKMAACSGGWEQMTMEDWIAQEGSHVYGKGNIQ